MDANEIRDSLSEYQAILLEYIELKATPLIQKADDLTVYEGELQDWLIAHQGVVGNIVARLVPRARLQFMGGSSWPSAIPAEHKHLVSTALVNLNADPGLANRIAPQEATPEVNRREATAGRLDKLADTMPEDDWTGQATEAQQACAATRLRGREG